MMNNRQYTDKQLEAYRQHLIQDYKTYCGGRECSLDCEIEFEPGLKYTRVVHITGWGKSRSAHSFIDAQGKIWKAASWKTPAKNFSRGDVTTPNFSRATWTGVS